MTNVTLKKACELTGKSKRTIQRYMASGKLSYTTNRQGNKVINVAELIRVFGELSPLVTPKVRPDVTPVVTPLNGERIEQLLQAVERLEKIVEKQSEQIAQLLQLEYKPNNEPDKPVSPNADKHADKHIDTSSLFDGLDFVRK
jgi:hypothetical protein